ncbi:MAG: hypothetical protein GY771_16240, partial [bacterium]|nr:hypothetical protein [bacterium]
MNSGNYETNTITLPANASNSHSAILIIADDGAGIDEQRIYIKSQIEIDRFVVSHNIENEAAVVFESTTDNATAFEVKGHGRGHGLDIHGGAENNTVGIVAHGTHHGIQAEGGAIGILANGTGDGATGIMADAQNNGTGIKALGEENGIFAEGGYTGGHFKSPTGRGLRLEGGQEDILAAEISQIVNNTNYTATNQNDYKADAVDVSKLDVIDEKVTILTTKVNTIDTVVDSIKGDTLYMLEHPEEFKADLTGIATSAELSTLALEATAQQIKTTLDGV